MAPNHCAFMAVTAHLEVRSAPLCLLLDLIEVAKAHTGFTLTEEFGKILTEFGIEYKVSAHPRWHLRRLTLSNLKLLAITGDNTKNNDAMFDELVDIVPDFPGRANQMRCFAHVVNLVAKTIIKQFDIPKKKPGKRDEDEDLLGQLADGIEVEEIETRFTNACEEEDIDNEEGWIDEVESLPQAEKRQLDREILLIHLVVVKVRLPGPVELVN
jgi:hypothetical protein